MYFTNYNTYNNNISWKPDNNVAKPNSISKHRYVRSSFKTINPEGLNCSTHNKNVTKSSIIDGTDFKAKPLIKNMYRYQYQTIEIDPLTQKETKYFTNSTKNLNITNKTPNDTNFTTTSNNQHNQSSCLYPDYKVNLYNKQNKFVTTNAKRRVRNSNKPSTNICINTAEQIIQDSHNKTFNKAFYKTNQNYYNKQYNHSMKQLLQNRCRLFNNNQNTFYNKDTNQYTSNCSHSVLPNIYYTDEINDKKACNNTITYKPNNKSFSQQGAVSSSARLLKLKKCTIDNASYQTNKQNNINIRVSNSGYNNQSNQVTSKNKFNASGYSNCNNKHPCDLSVYQRPSTC
jgi:hypothetical protein